MKILSLLLFSFFMACSLNVKKYSDDEIIGNSLIQISNSNNKYLISYLSKNPASILINPNNTQDCILIKTDPENVIYLPIKLKKNLPLITRSYLTKALYEYKIITELKLNHFFYEVEVLSDYLQMEVIFSDDINSIKQEIIFDPPLFKKLCAYLTSPADFEREVLNETKEIKPQCRYPLYDMDYYYKYYNSLKDSLNSIEGDEFFNTIYRDYLEKVKRGELTIEDAWKKYYYLTAEPIQELYRQKNVEISENLRGISRFKSFFNNQIKEFRKNLMKKQSLIKEFSECEKMMSR